MSQLEQYFRTSGYTPHRNGRRKEMLPECCQAGIVACEYSVKYIGNGGALDILPLLRCKKCGRQYIKINEKYVLVDDLMKFEIVKS